MQQSTSKNYFRKTVLIFKAEHPLGFYFVDILLPLSLHRVT